MSEPRGPCRLVLLVLLVPWAAPVAAQSRSELEARAASLRVELRGVEQAIGRHDSLRRAREGWQEIRVGGLALEAVPGDLAVSRRAAALAWERLAPRYAAAAEARPVRLRVDGRTVVRLDPVVPGSPVTTPVLPSPLRPDPLADGLVQVASEVFWSRADSTLRSWLPGPPPLQPDRGLLERVYVQLVTTRYHIVAACFRGDLAACRGSLGLPDPAGGRMPAFDAADQRALVRQVSGDWEPGWSPPARSCIDNHQGEACDSVVQKAWLQGTLRPLELEARAALVGEALAAGGAGSFDRLTGTEGSLSARLARASGLPFDSLLGSWHRTVLAARPPGPGPGRSVWPALGCSVLLFAAAMGASRWR